MSKYAKADKETAEVNGMVEEERRSKSYAKIINQQSAASLVSRREKVRLSYKTVSILRKQTVPGKH